MVNTPRSIDDFLSQLYAYRQRDSYYNGETTLTTSLRKRCFRRREIPLPLLALCISNASDATEILMLSYLLADARFREDMFSENSSSSMEGAELLASSIFVGMLVGGVVLGFLSDRIGRRPILLFGLVTNSVAGMCSSLSIFSPSFVPLTMWRFLAGVGVGATVPSLFTLVSEWSPKEKRGLFVTIVASFWMIGSICVSSIAWCLFQLINLNRQELSTWRIFAAFCAMPSLLGAWMVYNYVPESPRYFLTTGKRDYELAVKSCNQMAIYMGVLFDHEKESAFLGSSFDHRPFHPLTKDELLLQYQDDAKTSDSSDNIHSPTKRAKLKQSVVSALGTLRKLYSSQLLSCTLPLQILWFCLSFATYGITTWINTLFVSIQLENLYFNSFLFALASLPGNIVTLIYTDKCGRKRILIRGLIGAGCGLLLSASTAYSGSRHAKDEQGSPTRSFVIVLCACVFQAFVTICWNVIDILSGELFPTHVRSAGMGFCTATGRLGGILAQCVNAKLIIDDTGSGAAWVLLLASIALLLAAGMPLILDRDMTVEELKDDVIDCRGDCSDVTSDDQANIISLSGIRSLEYQSFQQEVESNEPFLL